MTTSETKPSGTGTLEHRLDALDRLLLGILPRSERLAIVSQVETRAREFVGTGSEVPAGFEAAQTEDVLAEAVTRRAATGGAKRRSRLALSSGVLGITALALLFAMPITYLFLMTIGEELGEWVSYSLLAIHVLAVALGGFVALAMGIAGLVSLARRKGQLVGHGWAITGLCTAPLPTLVGGLLVLVTAVSVFAVQSVTVSSPVITASGYSEPPTTCESCTTGYPAAPQLPATFPMPLPVSAAPSFCTSGEKVSPAASPVAYPSNRYEVQPQSEWEAPIKAYIGDVVPGSAVGPYAASAGAISWQTDVPQALKQAKGELKLVLVHFYSDSCPPCRVVERDVFPQPQVVQAIRRHYVPVKINVDLDEKTAAQFAVHEIPTDLVVDGDGKEMYRGISTQSAADFVKQLESVAVQLGRNSPTGYGQAAAAAAPASAPPLPIAPATPATAPGPPTLPLPAIAAPTPPAPAAPATLAPQPPKP